MHLVSHAKINWFLRVMEPREDGFHDLETVFQEVAFGDTLHFERTNMESCEITGFPDDVPLETNLIYRAWQLMRDEYPAQVSGLRVTADKRLPRGGGLGGGSSNAAAALSAIQELNELERNPETLEKLGARLGSDVPFFIRGGCATGLGRGEKLEQVPDVGNYHLVLLFPSGGVSTKEAFQRLDSMGSRPAPLHDLPAVIAALQSGDPYHVARVIYNDFELAVADSEWFIAAKSALESAGVLRAFLCGSGSTLAGLTTNERHARKIVAMVSANCAYTCCHTRQCVRSQGPID